MQRCLELAVKGFGQVSPNPLVGCVIVHANKIIGEGFHRQFGGSHAEVNAVNSVSEKGLLPESTIYVNLEPCSHFGKTPPCADLIIENRLKRVVIAQKDPFEKVSGNGIKKLINAGLEVECGILEDEAKFLNRRFNHFHKQGRPYIILKWAQSADGFLDPERKSGQKGSFPVSSPESRKLVHLWRSQEDAIMVGAGTVRIDDPSLTVREVTGNNPLRVVLGDAKAFPSTAKVFNNEAKTVIYGLHHENLKDDWKKVDPLSHFEAVLEDLASRNITSVLVEGGKTLLESILKRNLWDEIRVIRSKKYFGEGLQAPKLQKLAEKQTPYGSDQIAYYFRHS